MSHFTLGALALGVGLLGTLVVLLAVLRAAARDDENLAQQRAEMYRKRLRAGGEGQPGKWWGDPL